MKRKYPKEILLAGLFMVLSPVTGLLGAAGAAELVTDRPDQTESSVVVPKGAWQYELGWTYSRDDEDGVRLETHEVPGTLLRVGLSERVELRIGWAGQVESKVSAGDLSADFDGLGDAELGAKIHLAEERGARPETAVLLSTSVPVGEDAFTTDRWDPELRLAFAHTLSDSVDLGYNLGLGFESGLDDDGDRDTLSSAFYTLAVGFGLSDRLGAFVELFGDFPASAPGDPAHSFDGGFTYLLRPNLQLDLAGGVGLSDAADDWFVGLGVTVRLPD